MSTYTVNCACCNPPCCDLLGKTLHFEFALDQDNCPYCGGIAGCPAGSIFPGYLDGLSFAALLDTPAGTAGPGRPIVTVSEPYTFAYDSSGDGSHIVTITVTTSVDCTAGNAVLVFTDSDGGASTLTVNLCAACVACPFTCAGTVNAFDGGVAFACPYLYTVRC